MIDEAIKPEMKRLMKRFDNKLRDILRDSTNNIM